MTKRMTASPGIILALVTASVSVASCSGSREDVRVGFCKSLLTTQIDSPSSVRWTGVETRARGHSGLTVVLGLGRRPVTIVTTRSRTRL